MCVRPQKLLVIYQAQGLLFPLDCFPLKITIIVKKNVIFRHGTIFQNIITPAVGVKQINSHTKTNATNSQILTMRWPT